MDISGVLKQSLDKRREIFFYRQCAYPSLDEVENLGIFLEFEAVLGPNSDEDHEHGQLNRLSEQFGIAPSDLLAESYGEQILDLGAWFKSG